MPDIIMLLIRRQKELNLNNTEFAHLLGISRQLWEMTKKGSRNISTSLLSGVAGSFPDMDNQILEFLRSNISKGGGD